MRYNNKANILWRTKTNPIITSTLGFHIRYNSIIIPLISQDQIIIIVEILKKKLSKHKKNLSKRFLFVIIAITLPNVKNRREEIIIKKPV